KINLFLHVVGRRDDGYHLIDSAIAFAGVGDLLSVSPGDDLTLEISGPFAEKLIGDREDNLVLHAARDLRDAAAVAGGAKLFLEKRLPVASGIGGGSADAAAALRLLACLWNVPEEAATGLAVGLGADVPVCLRSAPAHVGGIGDSIDPLGPLPACGVVLANAGEGVSTPAVFAARSGGFSDPVAWRPSSSFSDLIELLRGTRNDLAEAARSVSPAIGNVIAALEKTHGCGIARLSGSGGTCFALYETGAAAAAAAEGLAAAHPAWWVQATRFLKTAPAIREMHPPV
ncbi:MAG: 4-(cytidine 5'-diphospho)-2-C-methyl-D-erythritol kinase, partial [Alphaproteobacteria bacterium]